MVDKNVVSLVGCETDDADSNMERDTMTCVDARRSLDKWLREGGHYLVADLIREEVPMNVFPSVVLSEMTQESYDEYYSEIQIALNDLPEEQNRFWDNAENYSEE